MADTTRRVMVGWDARAEGVDSIAAAVGLAELYRAELTGLFAEELLAADAAFPAPAVVDPHGTVRATDEQSVQRELRALVAVRRRALERGASALALKWSFELRPGNFFRVMLDAAREHDLTVVSHNRRAARRHGSVVCVVLDRERSRPVVAVAQRLAEQRGAPLRLVLVDGRAPRGAASLGPSEDEPLLVAPEVLGAVQRQLAPAVVVAPRDADPTLLAVIRRATPCPLILVR